jgi:ankyrin repeat protein
LSVDTGANVNQRLGLKGSVTAGIAAEVGSVRALDALIKAGVDLELTDSDGATPLFLALDKEQLEVVKLLLARGARREPPPGGTQTPLIVATQEVGRSEYVRLLLDAGANPNRRRVDGS